MEKKPGKQKAQAMVEFAIVIPIIVLLLAAILTFASGLMVYANAVNAANYGARRGSVAQENAIGVAMASAQARANALGGGEYTAVAYGGGGRGSQIVVEVHWESHSFLGSLGLGGGTVSGTATSSFRQEGW